MRKWLLYSLSIHCLSAPADVNWQISIAWEDEDCNSVCSSHGLACTEACWPFTAKGLRNALSSTLPETCFGIEAGSPNPWHPAKDPDNTMCYWFAGHSASQSPRCPQRPATPVQLLQESKVIRRLCPCVSMNVSSSAGFRCGLGDQPADPVVPVGQVPTSTTSSPEAGSGVVDPPPEAPEVLQPPMAVCQELCVSGFGAEDEKLNGKYIRLSGPDGALQFWLKLGGLPNGADCRLSRGADGTWRYYEVTSQGNTSIGEATLKNGLGDIPEDDYVLTPTGGFQVEYQCCPQELATTLASVDIPEELPQDAAINIAMIATVAGAGVVLCVSIVGICLIQRWKPGILRSKYQAFDEGKLSTSKASEDIEKPGQPVAGRIPDKAATWNTWSPSHRPGGQAALAKNQASGTKQHQVSEDRGATAVADVLGKSSAMASNDGIYEGPTRQWWGGSSGLGGTGFQKGAQVRLQGLTASAWNGMRGTVEGFDKSKGVLEVEVNGVLKLVKPENCIGDVGTAHSQGPVTPAQMRMQLNAAQLNPTGPPAPAGHQPFSRSSGEPNSRHSRAAGPAVGPAAGPRVDTSQIHKVVARPSRPI